MWAQNTNRGGRVSSEQVRINKDTLAVYSQPNPPPVYKSRTPVQRNQKKKKKKSKSAQSMLPAETSSEYKIARCDPQFNQSLPPSGFWQTADLSVHKVSCTSSTSSSSPSFLSTKSAGIKAKVAERGGEVSHKSKTKVWERKG